MGWHWYMRDSGLSMRLRPDPCFPPMRDMPKAGPLSKLPAPLVEGQEIEYRFYDDLEKDWHITAIAVSIAGRLQWAEQSRESRPRKMIGTAAQLFSIEELAVQISRALNVRREQWVFTRLSELFGSCIRTHATPELFRKLCADRGIVVERRIFPSGLEELWVNGKFDSDFSAVRENPLLNKLHRRWQAEHGTNEF